MSQMVLSGPFEKFELSDEHGLQPAAVGHLRLRQSLSPAAALQLREIRKRAVGNFKAAKLLEDLRPHRWCEPIARPRRVDQPIAFVVPEDQRVEGRRADRVAA